MSRKVMVVSGGRADYGLLRPTIKAIDAHPQLELQLVVTAMHLDERFGSTLDEVDVPIAAQAAVDVDLPMGPRLAAATASIADAMEGLEPDALVVLGDRYEMLGAALAATGRQIPIVHIHGGELSEGSLDDSFRHAITKLSHVHFAATREYAERICQLGEDPANVHVGGAAAIETIKSAPLLDRAALESELGIALEQPLVSLTFHGASLDPEAAGAQARDLAAAVASVLDSRGTVVVSLPNDDPGGADARAALTALIEEHDNVHGFDTLGHIRYLSLLSHADAVVGNSSSALIEAPLFELPALNVGERQRGRHMPANVVTVAAERDAIAAGLKQVLDPSFRAGLRGMQHPYGSGDLSQRVVDVLASADLQALQRKRFNDLPDGPWRAGLPIE